MNAGSRAVVVRGVRMVSGRHARVGEMEGYMEKFRDERPVAATPPEARSCAETRPSAPSPRARRRAARQAVAPSPRARRRAEGRARRLVCRRRGACLRTTGSARSPTERTMPPAEAGRPRREAPLDAVAAATPLPSPSPNGRACFSSSCCPGANLKGGRAPSRCRLPHGPSPRRRDDRLARAALARAPVTRGRRLRVRRLRAWRPVRHSNRSWSGRSASRGSTRTGHCAASTRRRETPPSSTLRSGP